MVIHPHSPDTPHNVEGIKMDPHTVSPVSFECVHNHHHILVAQPFGLVKQLFLPEFPFNESPYVFAIEHDALNPAHLNLTELHRSRLW